MSLPYGMRKVEPDKLDVGRRKIGGKWKPVIMLVLFSKPERFNKLKQLIGSISSNVLAKNLKDLEKNEIIFRTDGGNITYNLTQKGEQIVVLLLEIKKIVDQLP